MKHLYVTGNEAKFRTAQNILRELGVDIEQVEVDTLEIQSESITEIAEDKAKKAFEIIKQPLFVNDSGWFFLGLNGFPGPYMRYMNKWLTAENYLDLTRNLEDRRVILKQVIVWTDGVKSKVFEHNSNFVLLKEARGESPRTSDNLVGMTADGPSLGELSEKPDFKLEGEDKLWKELVNFLSGL